MVNQFGKFAQLAETTKPLRELLGKRNSWYWGIQQQNAFIAVKKMLTSPPCLALYDPQKETILTADASAYGLGAVLRQKQSDGAYRPVTFASRSMTPKGAKICPN